MTRFTRPHIKGRRTTRFRQLSYQPLEIRRVLDGEGAGGLDFGDLPDTGYGTGHNNYETGSWDNGPSHGVAGPRFGTWRDPENTGMPTIGAVGDDNNNYDDEDGITFGATMIRHATSNTTGSFYVDLQNAAPTANYLYAWIDFNKDGDFADAGETLFSSYSLGTTSQILLLNFTIPAGTEPYASDPYYGRFRVATSTGLTHKFSHWDGEVEDHVIPIKQPSAADLTVDMQHLKNHEVSISTTGSDLLIKSGANTLMQAPLASAKSLTVLGASGKLDTVTVDVTGTIPIPTGGLSIKLNDATSAPWLYPDQVNVIGTLSSSLAPTYQFSSKDDGTIKYYDGATLKHTITLEHVETLSDVTSGTSLTGTLKRDASALNLRLRAGTPVNGKITTKIDSANDTMPKFYYGEKSLSVITGAYNDQIAVKDTAGISTLTLSTGGANDIVSILNVAAATSLFVNTGDLNDLVYVGIEYGDPNVNSTGNLSNILGSVEIDGGTNMVGYADVVNVRDMSATADQTYTLSGDSITRAAGAIEIGLANVERVDMRTGAYVDTVSVLDTDDLTSFYLETSGSNDIVSVLGIDSGTAAEIYTRESNDLVFLGVQYGGAVGSSGNLTPIAGSLHIDGGSQTTGYADAINIRDMSATSGHTYNFAGGSFTRDSDVNITLASIEWIDLRVGSGDDVITNSMAFAAGFYASGENGNDTLTGGSGVDTLVGGNGDDILDGADGDDAFYLGYGNDTVYGGNGNDYINVGSYDNAVDDIFGGDGADLVAGAYDALDALTDIETDSRV